MFTESPQDKIAAVSMSPSPSIQSPCLVPPVEAVILDEKGVRAGESVTGYHEGSTLVLTCDILGGKQEKINLRILLHTLENADRGKKYLET